MRKTLRLLDWIVSDKGWTDTMRTYNVHVDFISKEGAVYKIHGKALMHLIDVNNAMKDKGKGLF